MVEVIHGDLLQAQAKAICQQVNCRNTMGAGIAKAIYTKWPIVKVEYHKYCEAVGSPYRLIGNIQIIKSCSLPFDVVNIFGQLNYGRQNCIYTNYNALQKAFGKLNLIYAGEEIAFPYGFGCGLAGGCWDVVLKLITEHFTKCHIKIYRLGE